MRNFKKIAIFVAVVIAIATFTSCENRLDTSDVSGNNFNASIKNLSVDYYALYASGEYDYLFDQFSFALSMLMQYDYAAREFVIQEFNDKGRYILLRHLLESDGSHLVIAALSNYVDVNLFLEYFQDMQIILNGDIDEVDSKALHIINDST